MDTPDTWRLFTPDANKAKAALSQAGVPGAFSPLLVGANDADTDARVERFRNTYQAVLAEDVRQRLPQQAPVVTVPAPQRVRRGIQRIH